MSMKISGKRLRRAGGAGPEAWVGRIGAGAIVLGGAWLAWNGMRSLPGAVAGEAASPTDVARVEFEASDVERRGALLARVEGRNAFSADGVAWMNVRPAVADERSGDDEPADEVETTVAADGLRPATPVQVGTIRITPEDKLSSDVKKAREELFLRGIRSSLDGAMIAMIAMNSVDHAKYSRGFAAGDEFVDQKHPKAKWRVVAVDAGQKVVVLNRSGENVVLSLYDQSEDARARLVSSGVSATGAKVNARVMPTIVKQSEDEIAAAMRAAGIADEEIAALLARARSDEVLSAPVKAGTEGGDPDGLNGTLPPIAPASEAPEGIDAIFKMMFSGGTPPMDAHLASPETVDPDAPEEPAPEPEPQ